MEFFKFLLWVIGGSAVATAMLGSIVKLLQVVQSKAVSSASKA